MPDLLEERRTRKLRAAVCTSATPGRLGGILNLLQARFPVREYWLPEGLAILPELARRFNGDLDGWLAAAGRSAPDEKTASLHWRIPTPEGAGNRLQGAACLLALAMAASRGSWQDVLPPGGERDPASILLYIMRLLSRQAAARWSGAGEETGTVLWTLGCRLLEGGSPENLGALCGRLMLDELDREGRALPRPLRDAVRVMILAAMTASLADREKADFRFFRPASRMVEHLVARHPLKCLNGVESAPLAGLARIAGPETILSLAGEMAQSGSGLVFQYGEARCGALFCGDTRMGFLGKGEWLNLDRPTVVAAPGSGSCSLERAYDHITSGAPSADVWVRGFLPKSHKVSEAFRRQENKFCLYSSRNLLFQEILLRFDKVGWLHEAMSRCC